MAGNLAPRTNDPLGTFSETEIPRVVKRLSSIYELAAARTEADGENIRQEATAVWCIGEILAACGGYDLMWLAFKTVEERGGSACPAWPNRSWDGIAIPGAYFGPPIIRTRIEPNIVAARAIERLKP